MKHFSLSRNLDPNFLTVPTEILWNYQSLIDKWIEFLFWFLFYLEPNGNHYAIHVIL